MRAIADAAGLAVATDWRFYLVFSMFRLAAILQGIARRARDGNASDADVSLGSLPALDSQAYRW